MTNKTGYTLIVTGLIAQAVDVLTAKDATGGMLFGQTGVLQPIDSRIPRVMIPWVNVWTNMAFWVIVLGAVIVVYNKVK